MFILILSLVGLFRPAENEKLISYMEDKYTFDTSNILESIDKNQKSFDLLSDTSTELPSNAVSLVQWTQADYLKIAQALVEFSRNEDLASWSLHSMFFRLNCSEVEYGPQYASLEFFKIVENSRHVIKVFIEPKKELLTLSYSQYSPFVYTWEIVELENIKIEIGDALKISEENGAATIRSENANACLIFGSISPGSLNNNGWRVLYSSSQSTDSNLIDFYINEKNGKFEIINSAKN